jgi:retron-type reverse transcriptase
MKTDNTHILRIRDAFAKMQTREDLLHLMNEVKPLIYGEKAVPFKLGQLTWYSNPKLCTRRYTEFKIRKKSGSYRSIHAPVRGLKAIQVVLAYILQCVFEPHKAAMGFVKGKSVVDNAKIHVGKNYVFNVDLKNFFPAIDQARVWKCLQLKPFELNAEESVEQQYCTFDNFLDECEKTNSMLTVIKGANRKFLTTPYGNLYAAKSLEKNKPAYVIRAGSGLRNQEGKSIENSLWLVNRIPSTSRIHLAGMIASLCCAEIEVERQDPDGQWKLVKRNVLPQGAPTSPVISNIVCQRLDFLLTGVAKRFGLKYSRYADDITFSADHNVFQADGEFVTELHRVIREQGFHINDNKTRLQRTGHRQEVTGLLVNTKVNVQKRYIKQLRMWLYYWERYGYEKASAFFMQQYLADKGHVNKGKPEMANIISGKLDYLKMVKGADNGMYIKLKSRLSRQIKMEDNVNKRGHYINHILELFINTGLDNAMNNYIPMNHEKP